MVNSLLWILDRIPADTYTIVSEIAVTRCLVDPEISGDLCTPDTTSEQDAIKGKWVRVEPNLNWEAGYLSGWLVGNLYPC